ncbi:TolC family protein, partial [Macromonas nakdongensis]|uniref:TolC family protein n=1 Tax=Macromonas nakdongensis TaxID=1843082 RepID=UPI0018E387E4
MAEPPAAGVSVPKAWSLAPAGTAAQADAATADWWTQFNDPQLSAWVTQALRANTTVRSAQAALQQARAQRDVTAAGRLPSVGVSASAQRSQVADQTPGNT